LTSTVAKVAPVAVPLIWAGSVLALTMDFVTDFHVEWAHLALWLAMAGMAGTCHTLTRHIIVRLTQIIALWQDDVYVLHRPTEATTVAPTGTDAGTSNVVPINENVVVPILRTAIARHPSRGLN
jgi:hypothetical protein